MQSATRGWWADELAACAFGDARLGQRMHRLIAQMNHSLGTSLPFACQDWANTKQAYRFDASAPGDLNARIGALLAWLPSGPSVWRELSGRYRCDVFCGLFLRSGNEGAELRSRTLSMLGERGLRLGLDIYACP